MSKIADRGSFRDRESLPTGWVRWHVTFDLPTQDLRHDVRTLLRMA